VAQGGNAMHDKKSFGLRIKAAREYRKFTLDSAAELCDVSLSTWKQYERGERLPSLPKFINLCRVLQVKPEYLLGPELDEQKVFDEIECLKTKIDQLPPDDIAVINAAVSKRLDLRNDN